MKLTKDDQGGGQLLDYVGGKKDKDQDLAASCYVQALALVNRYIVDVVEDNLDEEDVEAITGTVLEVGSKLWQRRNAPNGQDPFGELGGTGGLAPKDPMVTAYPVLNRYVPPGLA